MARITDIADQLAAVLNGHSFSRTFTAQRAYRPLYELKDLTDLKVTVVPKAMELASVTRGSNQRDIQIDIGIQQKLPAVEVEQTELDALMDLTEEIADFVLAIGVLGTARVVSISNDPIYAPEHLDEWRVFTSVITVTLRRMDIR